MNYKKSINAAIIFMVGLHLSAAIAQTGAIKIIVGYPPGATSDALTRVFADALSKRLNQAVVVENKPGAGGMLANQAVKAAPPDGTTLLMTPVATMSIFPHSYSGQIKYDPFKDFVPVAHLSNFQLGLGVATKVPATNLKEYVAWVKSDTQKNAFYGSAASGSLPHFFGVMFAKNAAITALSTVAADIQTLVDGGRARLLAVAGEKRSPQFPNVPTFKEQGFDLVATPWYALFTTSGTPAATVDRLSRAAMEVIREPAVQQRLIDMGLEPTGYGPDRLNQIMKADYDKWGPPIRESGFKPD
jgi:tripartite-type tricarboxylate transporter receptor subunit TctC